MKSLTLIARIGALTLITALMACGAPSASVPEPLNIMEHAAEDIIDYAPAGSWDKIDADVRAIDDAWQAYQPQASGDGAAEATGAALSSALVDLQGAATNHDPAATMQAANNLSAAVIELFALYDPPIPADIGRLDVLERQVILDVSAQDFQAAATSLNKTKAVWTAVKPSLAGRDGADVEAAFETSLAAQEVALASNDAAALTAEARNGLELVDALEKLY